MSTRYALGPPGMVNEIAARLVAAQVAIVAGAILALGLPGLLALLVWDFGARVSGAATLSPFAQLAARVLLPALGRPFRPTPSAPKRFAQAIGLLVSASALALWLVWAQAGVGRALLGLLLLFATLEATLGFCVGCWLFGRLMRWGFLPASVCEACAVAERPTAGLR